MNRYKCNYVDESYRCPFNIKNDCTYNETCKFKKFSKTKEIIETYKKSKFNNFLNTNIIIGWLLICVSLILSFIIGSIILYVIILLFPTIHYILASIIGAIIGVLLIIPLLKIWEFIDCKYNLI